MYCARWWEGMVTEADLPTIMGHLSRLLIQTETYDYLDDPTEREWLINVAPRDVLANAHRMYDFMAETGMAAESMIRELAFRKAAAVLDLDYDVLYTAWVDQVPAPTA